MSSDRHLELRLYRLKPGQDWKPARAGLLFLFAQGGAGEYVSGVTTQPLGSGDVLVFQAGDSGTVRAAPDAEFLFSAFSVCFDQFFPLFIIPHGTNHIRFATGLQGME